MGTRTTTKIGSDDAEHQKLACSEKCQVQVSMDGKEHAK